MNLRKHEFDIAFSDGAPLVMEGNKIKMPRHPGHLNYVRTRERLPMSLYGKTIHFAINIKASADAKFWYPKADPENIVAPSIRPYIEFDYDIWDRKTNEFGRWWSTEGFILQPGRQSMSVQVRPSDWSSVFGKPGEKYPNSFRNAVSDPCRVGFTLGGGGSYGHGANMIVGTAQLLITKFAIN